MLPNSAVMVVLLVGFQSARCAAGDVTLTFPDDRDCGKVAIGPQPTVKRGWALFPQPKVVGNARGVLTVPQDAFVELSVSPQGTADLSFLKALPAGAIHSVKMEGALLGDAELAFLARFTGLRNLALSDCRLSATLDVSAVPGAPVLESLRFSTRSDEGQKTVAAWAAKCPKLQYIYDQGEAFDVASVRQFEGHPSLDFLTVELGADAAELISALNDIPRLRALNVQVKTDDRPWNPRSKTFCVSHGNEPEERRRKKCRETRRPCGCCSLLARVPGVDQYR